MSTSASRIALLSLAFAIGCGTSGPAPPTLPDPPTTARSDLFPSVSVRLNGQDLLGDMPEFTVGAEVRVEAEITPGAAAGGLKFAECHFLMDGPDERPRIVKDWPSVDIPSPGGADSRTMIRQVIRAPERPGEYEFRLSIFTTAVKDGPTAAVGKVRVVP